MTPESLRDQTEELWRETFAEALAEWELNLPCPRLKQILKSGVALEVISESAANKIAAALGVG